jgi:hypothetical protein
MDRMTDASEEALGAYDARQGRHRTNDHETSVAGAKAIGKTSLNQRGRLLYAYSRAKDGFTSEEAANFISFPVRSCWWKRVSELEQDGYIESRGKKRKGVSGVGRRVLHITEEGKDALAKFHAEHAEES